MNTQSNIIPTSDLIKTTLSLMSELNQSCFGGLLDLNFPVDLSNRANAAGHIKFSYIRFSGFYKTTGFQISKHFNWTMEQLKDVVAHELIHVYEIQILKQKPAHQSNFKQKMNSINSMNLGLTVVVYHSMKSTKVKKSKTSSVPYILSEDGRKFNLLNMNLAMELTKDPTLAKRLNYGNYTLGQVSADKVSQFKTRRSLTGGFYPMTAEKLQTIGISSAPISEQVAA